MLHQTIAAPRALAPLRPNEYLRLRREAAGMKLEQVAEILAPNAQARRACLAFLRLWEAPCIIAQRGGLLQLQRAFPLDPDVYHQLATEPADRHPDICRGCGCSRWDQCQGDNCACTLPDRAALCTRCAPDAAA